MKTSAKCKVRGFVLLLMMLICAGPVTAQDIDLGNYYALLIANEKYQHWPNLSTPHEDVADLEAVLRDQYGFETIVIKDATRGEIIDKLESLKSHLNERDSLLIYYAGHGTIRSDGGFWIGIDASQTSRSGWLHYRTLSTLLDVEAGMKARHILVIADSCYSGAALRIGNNIPRRPPNEQTAEWLRRVARSASRTVLSSGGVEPVVDRVGNSRNSIFAKELIEKLGAGDSIIDGVTLWNNIKTEVYHRAARVLGRQAQAPEYGPIYGIGHNGGDFLFLPKNFRTVAIGPAAAPEAGTSVEIGIRGGIEGPRTVEPSFDCAKATTIVEILICDVPILSVVDAELGVAYRELRHRLPPVERQQLRERQISWIRSRDELCVDNLQQIGGGIERTEMINCIYQQTQDRTIYLTNYAGGNIY